MINIVIFGLICFSIGLITGVGLVLTIVLRAMKMLKPPKMNKGSGGF